MNDQRKTLKATPVALTTLRTIAASTREKQYVILERALQEELKRVKPSNTVDLC